MSRSPFYLVGESPWPFLAASSAYFGALGFIMWVWGENGVYSSFGGLDLIALAGVSLVFTMIQWWRDVAREGRWGFHTRHEDCAMWEGFLLFLVSEAMFFFSLFWALLHSSLAPDVGVFLKWPPLGVRTMHPAKVPLLGTSLLIVSGGSIKYAHYAIVVGNRLEVVMGMLMTMVLGALFLRLQAFEYYWASFSMMDSVFGSVFYMLTGFHGMHVIFGLGFLTVTLVRVVRGHFTPKKHVAFKACAWYWHFVDWVWVAVFLVLYCWSF